MFFVEAISKSGAGCRPAPSLLLLLLLLSCILQVS
jgi:hypothetical protein